MLVSELSMIQLHAKIRKRFMFQFLHIHLNRVNRRLSIILMIRLFVNLPGILEHLTSLDQQIFSKPSQSGRRPFRQSILGSPLQYKALVGEENLVIEFVLSPVYQQDLTWYGWH